MDNKTRSRVEAMTGDLLMAEREFAAYVDAVDDLFGPEQSRQSAEDWLEALTSMDWSDEKTGPDWRQVSIAAAARLAHRLKA